MDPFRGTYLYSPHFITTLALCVFGISIYSKRDVVRVHVGPVSLGMNNPVDFQYLMESSCEVALSRC